MKRVIALAAAIYLLAGSPAWAQQQNEIVALRAEIAKQQAVIQQLLQRLDALEKQQTSTPAAVQDELKAQEDAIASIRETINSKVNLNGYYNFRFFADTSDTPIAFQQHHLGVLMAKQLGRFNFLTELELQNVPHHPEISGDTENHAAEVTADTMTDISGEGEVAVENAWMEYNHNRFFGVRVGKQLSPQYWWQNHYPNLTYSTDAPIYLRELFPAELVGLMVQGSAAHPTGSSELGVGYKFYVANNDFEGNSRSDLRDGKAWGLRGQLRFPTGGMLKKADIAGDIYRGHVGLVTNELVEDNVAGFEAQLEISRFLFQSEYARGRSLGQTRTGYYVQPAVRLSDDWLGFYRVEELVSPRIFRAERRHLAGINYRPYPQIAIKGEFYRAIPLERSFTESHDGEELKPFNGFATAAVFFF